MSDNIPGISLAPGVRAAESDVRFSFSRSGGPGGQNVNKVNTRAELRIRPEQLLGLSYAALDRLRTLYANRITFDGDLQIFSDSERTQERNRAECLSRLRQIIVHAQQIPRPRRKTKPSRGSKERRLKSKREHSEKKRLREKPGF